MFLRSIKKCCEISSFDIQFILQQKLIKHKNLSFVSGGHLVFQQTSLQLPALQSTINRCNDLCKIITKLFNESFAVFQKDQSYTYMNLFNIQISIELKKDEENKICFAFHQGQIGLHPKFHFAKSFGSALWLSGTIHSNQDGNIST